MSSISSDVNSRQCLRSTSQNPDGNKTERLPLIKQKETISANKLSFADRLLINFVPTAKSDCNFNLGGRILRQPLNSHDLSIISIRDVSHRAREKNRSSRVRHIVLSHRTHQKHIKGHQVVREPARASVCYIGIPRQVPRRPHRHSSAHFPTPRDDVRESRHLAEKFRESIFLPGI